MRRAVRQRAGELPDQKAKDLAIAFGPGANPYSAARSAWFPGRAPGSLSDSCPELAARDHGVCEGVSLEGHRLRGLEIHEYSWTEHLRPLGLASASRVSVLAIK
jgi:hypothetical protein